MMKKHNSEKTNRAPQTELERQVREREQRKVVGQLAVRAGLLYDVKALDQTEVGQFKLPQYDQPATKANKAK